MERRKEVDFGNYRHELKFLCREQELYLIENKIRHICKLDANVETSGNYLIKSLYFDTYNDQCYFENQAGVDDRKKYRIRIYNNSTDIIKLECKYSFHNKKKKEMCGISRQQCEILMRGIPGEIMPDMFSGQELLRCFLLEKNMNLLLPKVIVEYTRTPYVYAAGNVRITFDRTIRSSFQVAHFLDDNITFRSILPTDIHILEVKYNEILPAAILELLTTGHSLSKTSFSKYSLCREYGVG